MELLKKNSIAVTIFVLTVVLSIFISGHLGLSSQANRVLDVFYYGERNDGLSIYSDMKDLVEASQDIVSLSQKVMDPSTMELVSMNKAISDFQSAQTPEEYYQVYARLNKTAEDVGALFAMCCKDETQMKLFKEAAAVFASKCNTISYDPYNRYVREYEKVLDNFPAKWIAKITRVVEVTAFE